MMITLSNNMAFHLDWWLIIGKIVVLSLLYQKGDKSMNDKRSNLSEFVPGEEAVSIKIKLPERKLDLQ